MWRGDRLQKAQAEECATAHDFLGLLYCLIVLLCIFVCPYVIYYPTVMARYSLFVLKVPLNPNKQTSIYQQDGSQKLQQIGHILSSVASIYKLLSYYTWYAGNVSSTFCVIS